MDGGPRSSEQVAGLIISVLKNAVMKQVSVLGVPAELEPIVNQ